MARFAGAVMALLAPAAALAGAWTYPTGQGQIIETLFGWAGEGPPYGGAPGANENRVEAQTYVEYGLADRLTVVGQTALERYELTGPPADVFRGLDYSSIGLRANLWSHEAVVISAQATAFVPGAHDSSRPAQAGDTGGAGEARALVGYNFSFFGTPAFLDAEAAFRLRCAGPPDEWHFDVTLGLKPNARVMWLLQSYNTISPWSSSPIFPAWSSYGVQLSIVYALDEHWSVQAGLHDRRDLRNQQPTRTPGGDLAEFLSRRRDRRRQSDCSIGIGATRSRRAAIESEVRSPERSLSSAARAEAWRSALAPRPPLRYLALTAGPGGATLLLGG